MGAPWRDHPAWAVVARAEDAFGEPLAHLLLDAPAETLARTREAQLAVLLTSLVAWEAVRDRVPAPVAFAGHSLGQVTALIAAGTLDLEDGVRFAARRAELTQRAADDHPGKMAALLGATVDQAEDACTAARDACWIANDNAPGQVVIAGTPDGVDAACARAKEIGVKRATPLKVGGAFHTPLMRDAADALADRARDRLVRGTRRPDRLEPRRRRLRRRRRMACAPATARHRARALARVDGDHGRRGAPPRSSRSATARCSPAWPSAPHPTPRSAASGRPTTSISWSSSDGSADRPR